MRIQAAVVHVVLTFASCGQCRNCRRGLPTACITLKAVLLMPLD